MSIIFLQYLLISLFGFVLAIVCIVRLMKIFFLKSNYIKTDATVAKIDYTLIKEQQWKTTMKIRFATINNENILVQTEDTTYPSSYKEGDEIKIAYNANNSNDFIILSMKQKALYFILFFCRVAMAIFGCINLVSYFKGM